MKSLSVDPNPIGLMNIEKKYSKKYPHQTKFNSTLKELYHNDQVGFIPRRQDGSTNKNQSM